MSKTVVLALAADGNIGDVVARSKRTDSMRVVADNLEKISIAEIVVGIPTGRDAAALAALAQQADRALALYYGNRSAVIVACDDHDDASTRHAFVRTRTRVPKVYVSTENGPCGKGNSLLALLRQAVVFSASAVMVVDAAVPGVSPQRIRNLGEPLFQDYHFVAPIYQRRKYEAPFTSNLAYPLTRALYGRRVRHPMPDEFGVSGDLARIFLESEFSNDAVPTLGVAIWMTTVAMHSKMAVIQSFVGSPGTHRLKGLPVDDESVFKDVMATMFQLMCRYQQFWQRVKWSRPTAVFGTSGADSEISGSLMVDTNLLWKKMTTGLHKHWDLCSRILYPDNVNELEVLAGLPVDRLVLPSALWARIVFDFAVEFKRQSTAQDELLDAFLATYCARILSFVLETQEMNARAVEQYVEDQCLIFEKTKPYLLHRWFFQ
ncbi:MAG: glycosyl transferase [Deltaproteobacteria bacterium]|nr:glycosyl transferase [Deltaproteobacteria bacterium]